MRVVFISPYPPARDGLATYTAALVDAMRASGDTVRVVTARSCPTPPPEVLGSLPRSPRGCEELYEKVRGWDPDVIHVQFTVAGFTTQIGVLLRMLRMFHRLRARVFVTFHEVTGDTALLGLVGRAIYRRVGRCADCVVVHTQAALQATTARIGVSPSRVFVTPHPAMAMPGATTSPLDLRERHGLRGSRVLLFFGFIHVDKGLSDLVRALRLLAAMGDDLHDVRVVVAGAVPVRRGAGKPYELRNRLCLAALRRSIARWGLAERVIFTGYVPAGEIAPWFDVATAAVLPYRRCEQSGVASLAAGSGTPLLVSRVGGLVEMASAPSWTFPPRAPGQLAETLAEFLREGGRCGQADDRMDRPSVSEVARQTAALYITHTSDREAPIRREVVHA